MHYSNKIDLSIGYWTFFFNHTQFHWDTDVKVFEEILNDCCHRRTDV